MIVELAGPVGAGKSAVAAALPKALRELGLSASLLTDIARFSRPMGWGWNAFFAIRHPRLVWTAWRAVRGAPIPGWHRRLILGLVLGVGGRIEFARRRVPLDHLVIVDEGLVHRSVNLFGWYPAPPLSSVREYVARVPLADALVYVESAPDIEHARTLARGVPKRLAGRSAAEVSAFVAQARLVCATAVESVEARGGTAVARVANLDALDSAVDDAAAFASGLARRGALRPTAPMVPRPDRAVARLVAGRPRGIPPAQLEAVLAAYGLPARGRPRTLSAPGSRGATVRLSTPDGDVVVKRYKDSVDGSSVRIEHAVLATLAAAQYPAPRLRHTPEGESFVTVEGGSFAVYDALHGYRHPHEMLMASRDRREVERLAGTMLADLHRTLEAVDVPPSASLGFVSRDGPRVREVEWYTSRLEDADVPSQMRAWAATELRRLSERLAARQLPLTVVHGDFGPYNLMLKRGAPAVLVDYELARLDWRLVDLATGLVWWAQRRRRFDVDAARRVLSAYRASTDASTDELQLIPEVLALLALQRAVVVWTRDEGDARRDAEARTRIGLADALLAGTHPLNAVVRPW